MNTIARNIVTARLNKIFPNGIKNLYFAKDSRNGNFLDNPFSDIPLKDAIITCLELNGRYYSATQDGHLETRPGANRSVIDVWRHLKSYNEELTIFDVMAEVYNLIINSKIINTFICGDINRRVLIVGETTSYAFDKDICDSLHITLDEWNNI